MAARNDEKGRPVSSITSSARTVRRRLPGGSGPPPPGRPRQPRVQLGQAGPGRLGLQPGPDGLVGRGNTNSSTTAWK